MPELSDEELAELRTAKAEREQAKKDAKDAKDAAAKLQQERDYVVSRYKTDTATLQQELQKTKQPVVEEDPEVLERRTEIGGMVSRAIQDGVAPLVGEYLKGQRNTARQLAKQNAEIKKYLDHPTYGKEIEAMLDAQPAGAAANVEAYELAMRAVKGLHFDDLQAERDKEREATTAGDENDEDVVRSLDEEEPTSERAAPLPTSARVATPATRTKQRKFTPLDRTEQQHARRMGLTDEEFDRYSHPELTSDIMGFKGRDSV